MPEFAAKCKGNSNVFNDMREILALDLTRNELKVLIACRVEMDEATRQVRGKSQADLRAVTGLGRSQFSDACASLQRRGLIVAKRARNAPQLITVPHLDGANQVNRETRTSGKPGHLENPVSGQPENPVSGQPENPVDDIYTAPVTTPKSAPKQTAPLPEVSDLKKLSDRLFAIAEPCLASRAIAPGLWAMTVPQMWIDEGCDLERDIVPTIQAIAARGKVKASTWDYFTRPIAEARAKRLAGLPPVEIAKTADVLPFKVTTAMNVKPRLEAANA